MRIIDFSPRQRGKTTRIIEWLAKDERRIMLTFSFEETARLRNQYPKLSHRIFPADEYTKQHRTKNINAPDIAIDNLDMVLEKWFGDVVYASFSKDTIDKEHLI